MVCLRYSVLERHRYACRAVGGDFALLPCFKPELRTHYFWSYAAGTYQRSGIRLCGQWYFYGGVLLTPAFMQGPDVQRCAEQNSFLGMAAYYCSGRYHALDG